MTFPVIKNFLPKIMFGDIQLGTVLPAQSELSLTWCLITEPLSARCDTYFGSDKEISFILPNVQTTWCVEIIDAYWSNLYKTIAEEIFENTLTDRTESWAVTEVVLNRFLLIYVSAAAAEVIWEASSPSFYHEFP